MKYTIQEYDIPGPDALKEGGHVHYSLELPGVPIFLPIVMRDGLPHLFAIVNTNNADEKYRFVVVPTGGLIDSGFSYNPLGSWMFGGVGDFYHLFEIKANPSIIVPGNESKLPGKKRF